MPGHLEVRALVCDPGPTSCVGGQGERVAAQVVRRVRVNAGEISHEPLPDTVPAG